MKKILGIILLIGFFVGVYFYYKYDVENLGGNGGAVVNNGGTASPSFSPEEVVTMYTRATLGRIAGSLIDYDLAKTLLGSEMKAQWTDDSFVPLSYGIQDGPDEIAMEEAIIKGNGNIATMNVNAYWGGELQVVWNFTLELVNNEWKITILDSELVDLFQ